MKRMLFNATQAEELRVAIVDGQKLIDLDIESASKEQKKSNIYKAVITRLEPSLEAAFVDYGAERHGFLPFKEISRVYFQPGVDARASIKEALREGQELIVQVDKDERGNKGAALTTFISLAGRYLVLMPNNPRGGGVSRRVEGDERAELREIMDNLDVPSGMSLIARTAAIGRASEELQWDLNYLLQLWKAIDNAANDQKGAFLIYPEGNLVIRAVRDYFQPDIGEILIDTDDIFEQASQFMSTVMPGNVNRIKRYQDDVPLFSRFQIEHQIESAYSRQVTLPSGGAIVIDHTEALVSVDVNSGRATRGSDIEDTAFKTNLEAAEEVARQLRLRDLGGLIVIDFIDMESTRNQREVENHFKDCLRFDRARVQTGKISRFGLLELSRQRLRPALAETSYIACPRCSGTGHIRSTESAALHILRILEEEAMKDNTAAVHTQVPIDVATFLLNEKRQDINRIELRQKVSILLIPNTHLETPQHEITRLRHEDLNQEDGFSPSYKMVEAPEDAPAIQKASEHKAVRQEAAVKGIIPMQAAPIMAEKVKPQKGLFATISSWLFGDKTPVEPPKPVKKGRNSQQRDRNERNDARRKNGNKRNDERENKEGKDNKEPRDNRQRAPRDASAANQNTQNANQNGRNDKTREPKEGREPRENRRPKEELAAPKTAENLLDATVIAQHLENPPSAGTLENSVSEEFNNDAIDKKSDENNPRRRQRRGHRRIRERAEGENANENISGNSYDLFEAVNEGESESAEKMDVTREKKPAEMKIEAPRTEIPVKETTAQTFAPHEAKSETVTEIHLTAQTEMLLEMKPESAQIAPIYNAAESRASLESVIASSGLQMVETVGNTNYQAIPETPAPRGRKPRVNVAIADEPLIMVETQAKP